MGAAESVIGAAMDQNERNKRRGEALAVQQ
jgi:hypothetical protein